VYESSFSFPLTTVGVGFSKIVSNEKTNSLIFFIWLLNSSLALFNLSKLLMRAYVLSWFNLATDFPISNNLEPSLDSSCSIVPFLDTDTKSWKEYLIGSLRFGSIMWCCFFLMYFLNSVLHLHLLLLFKFIIAYSLKSTVVFGPTVRG